MNELKQLEAQRDDEIEIDLGEIFHLLLNKLWVIILCFIVGASDLGLPEQRLLVTPTVLRFLDDLHFTKDKKRDIPCGYSRWVHS